MWLSANPEDLSNERAVPRFIDGNEITDVAMSTDGADVVWEFDLGDVWRHALDVINQQVRLYPIFCDPDSTRLLKELKQVLLHTTGDSGIKYRATLKNYVIPSGAISIIYQSNYSRSCVTEQLDQETRCKAPLL